MTRRKEIDEDTFKVSGFKRQELTDFFYSKGKCFDFGIPPMNFDDESFEAQSKNTSNPTQDIPETKPPTTTHDQSDCLGWKKTFAGRAAALDIIGAISKILVEKSGNKYLHGENVSANAIADSVVEMMDTINKNKSPENYRKLIGEALKISGLSTEE